ncbi:2-C-methyl-D-erythritol 4-phosphate cytidylyltransferase [Halioxenophilus aromaticivorans]|uniref:2-C-methyl-D-erythritol 4-phosphate cytidylyltransferase n=1 Tax=Halioxenophilus aromaticivorans TaxID=1306992 RepID=A0AAV3U9U9_9ALTE
MVPAAGIGSRMAADIPKQYLPLHNATVIEWTLRKLLAVQRVRKVVVAVAEHDPHWPQLAISQHPQIVTTGGGAERADSVLAGLGALQGLAQSNDWVLVHDAARPCVQPASINRMIDELHDHPVGGILAVPVADTLKYASPREPADIDKTVDRKRTWAAQTPQMFRYGELLNALQNASGDGFIVTDEASALEHLGVQPRLVVGRTDNLKITTPDDLALAQLILASQSNLLE